MKGKYLPIKFFEKRKDYDDRGTEGGGNKNIPLWVLSGNALAERTQKLSEDIINIKEKISSKEKRKLPIIMSSKIEEKALAKSYRDSIKEFLNCDKKDNVIGFHKNDQIISIIKDEKILDNMELFLENPEKKEIIISCFLNIGLFEPFIKKVAIKDKQVYKIKLIDYNDYDLNILNHKLFQNKCLEKNIEIKNITKYTSDLLIYRVALENLSEIDTFEDFEGIYSIEPMEYVDVALDSLNVEPEFNFNKKKEEKEYPKVGVLDTGIFKTELISEWLLSKKHLNYPIEYQDNRHGTFVAGIIEYGDILNNYNISSLDGIEIFDATVYPDPSKERIYIDDLIENIREAIEKNKDIKIWNLSLGTNIESELERFSDFGMALDNIQDENNVLIIKSSGNCTNFIKDKPKSRIAKSADSVRSLVVGSIAQIKTEYDEADKNYPSPFTRIGPGPNFIVKPDLVHYGGNAGVENGKLLKNGVTSLGKEDKLVKDCGTSFSTPIISRIAAELNFLLKEEFDPLLIKTMLIHSAKYPNNLKMDMSTKLKQMGFGIPEKANDILYNSSNEITLILRDTLEKGSFIEMFDFPYPKDLVDEYGYFRGQMIVTLVTKTLLDEKQDSEYCQSNIDLFFGTYKTEKERDITKPIIKNQYGIEDGKNFLNNYLYTSKVMKADIVGDFARERTLVKYGKKYHPVKKYAIDLSDFTPSNKEKYLQSDRKWFLKIKGLYRDFIENDYERKDQNLAQEYCLLLTIRDPEKKVNVYDEISQLLTENNFIHHDITLRERIRMEA